jgi:hypothetical protein
VSGGGSAASNMVGRSRGRRSARRRGKEGWYAGAGIEPEAVKKRGGLETRSGFGTWELSPTIMLLLLVPSFRFFDVRELEVGFLLDITVRPEGN